MDPNLNRQNQSQDKIKNIYPSPIDPYMPSSHLNQPSTAVKSKKKPRYSMKVLAWVVIIVALIAAVGLGIYTFISLLTRGAV